MNSNLEFRVRELMVAQGALAGIGDILFRRHMSQDFENLTEGDIEGLSLAIKSIATHIGDIVEDMDHHIETQGSKDDR